MQIDVELQTQPFATSDPDSPITVKTATTVYNQDDSVAGYVTITAADVKGTRHALTQLRARNLVSGTWAAIEWLWYARRTQGTLASFNPILEGGTADTDSSIHWSTESDTTRRSDNYLRYAPPEAANDLWAYREYTISNVADHEGKAAIAVVCRNMSEEAEDWDLKAALVVSEVVMETGIKNVAAVGVWTVLILGELDIPPTPMSDDESHATKVRIYLRRTSGAEAIDIDFAMLLFVDEYPQQVNIGGGFTDSYKLLMENFDRELCHIVDQSTLAFEKVAEPLCRLLQLRPGMDNRLDFIWERLGRVYEVLADTFTAYEAWWWLPINDCDVPGEWTGSGGGVSADTTYYVEGVQGLQWTWAGGTGWAYVEGQWDFSVEGRFGNNDFVYITYYLSNSNASGGLWLQFYTSAGNYYTKGIPGTAGRHFVKVKKSEFTAYGSPDWSNITCVQIQMLNTSTATTIYFDDIRVVRADPDDATKGNDTGSIWDPVSDVWHVEEQDSGNYLGCIDTEAGVEKVALIHEEPPANIKYLAKVKAKRDDGKVGLVFRCEDGTSGSEDMAAFYIDTSSDKLELEKWAAGAASDIATAVDQVTAPDIDYYLGVWILDTSRIRCYFGTALSDIWDSDNKEFKVAARKFDETDSVFASGGALSGGQCGVLSIGTLGRFGEVELYAVGEGHVPGDTAQVEIKALYRTIYPFRE